MCGTLASESSPGRHQQMGSWKGVSTWFVRGGSRWPALSSPWHILGFQRDNQDVLDCPTLGTFLSLPLASQRHRVAGAQDSFL